MGGRKKKGKEKRRGGEVRRASALSVLFSLPSWHPSFDSWSQPAEVMGNLLRF